MFEYDIRLDDRSGDPMKMVFHCYTHPTFTVLSIPTWPEPFAARPLRKHLTALATVVFLRIANEELRHINSATAWFIRRGSIFQVPLLTIYLEPRKEGLGLIDVKDKCITLFLNRSIRHLHGGATPTGDMIELWNRTIAPGDILICFQYQLVSGTYVFSSRQIC
jgi:hypothetical protein